MTVGGGGGAAPRRWRGGAAFRHGSGGTGVQWIDWCPRGTARCAHG